MSSSSLPLLNTPSLSRQTSASSAPLLPAREQTPDPPSNASTSIGEPPAGAHTGKSPPTFENCYPPPYLADSIGQKLKTEAVLMEQEYYSMNKQWEVGHIFFVVLLICVDAMLFWYFPISLCMSQCLFAFCFLSCNRCPDLAAHLMLALVNMMIQYVIVIAFGVKGCALFWSKTDLEGFGHWYYKLGLVLGILFFIGSSVFTGFTSMACWIELGSIQANKNHTKAVVALIHLAVESKKDPSSFWYLRPQERHTSPGAKAFDV